MTAHQLTTGTIITIPQGANLMHPDAGPATITLTTAPARLPGGSPARAWVHGRLPDGTRLTALADLSLLTCHTHSHGPERLRPGTM